jgi:phosphotransferase system HPr (HPr) family protein
MKAPEPTMTMSNDPPAPIARRQVEIRNALGLHLRPAEKFVGLAGQFQSEIRVTHQGRECNGKSMLDLMTLAALPGARLDLVAIGPDAEVALEALVQLVDAHFHEDDNGEDIA